MCSSWKPEAEVNFVQTKYTGIQDYAKKKVRIQYQKEERKITTV